MESNMGTIKGINIITFITSIIVTIMIIKLGCNIGTKTE